ncbi:MAG: hypothetical protein II032_01370, partial [Treponema sp.]|nr:hypothetical protein [Treponema sp.]
MKPFFVRQQLHNEFSILVVDHAEDNPDMRILQFAQLASHVLDAVAVMACVANGERVFGKRLNFGIWNFFNWFLY